MRYNEAISLAHANLNTAPVPTHMLSPKVISFFLSRGIAKKVFVFKTEHLKMIFPRSHITQVEYR
jgi:hypothetical protein